MHARAALTAAGVWLLCLLNAEAREPWVVLKDCRLLRNESADADSFQVSAAGKEYIFRLYFVDAPETDMSIADRVKEQAQYFGLKPEQTITLGEYAKRFTKEKLAHPFTVRTCMQDAMGRSKLPRYYAFVETKEGDLAELLVTNGLARLHGAEAQPVGLRSPERQWERLKRLEREAKQQKVGAWGAMSGRMAARSTTVQPKTGPDSFDAFFHPERFVATNAAAAATPMPAVPMQTSTPLSALSPSRVGTVAPLLGSPNAAAQTGGKLDINSASSEELLNVPGIGPVLAQRIIDARPFQSADELTKVKGIGPKIYERIRQHFR
jgi:competence protein ComEA